MGHRQMFNTSQFFETEQDWSHGHPASGQSYIHMGRAASQENGSFSHPINPTAIDGPNCASRRNLENGVVEHSSTYFRSEGLQVHAPLSAPPHDVFPHCPTGGSLYPPPELNATHAHSNHHNRHGIHEGEGGVLDHTMNAGRGPFKRKSPGVSTSWERGGTSSMYSAGSSSNSFELHHEKPTSDYRNYFPDSSALPPYMGSSLTIGGEDPPRNVRSRSRLDLEPNPRRTHLPSYTSHPFSSTSHLRNHLGPVDVADRTAYEHNQNGVPPPAHGRFHTSENNSLSHEMHQHYAGGNPTDTRRYNHDSILSRNPVAPPRHLHGFHAQASREGQNSYSRRALPTRRADINSSHFRQEAVAAENGQHFLSETHNSRYPRPPSSGGWHSNHREGRSRISIERFQSLSNVVDARDRIGSEALMMLDHSYLYGSRNLFDQYRDMRLDVDSMSYEELIALGERIGSVNTGLPEDVFSKCLMETTCRSSDKAQEETSCAICLEEYRSMDKVGTIQNCGHVYHVDCIKKWLSMKNMCPICKAPAVPDCSNKD
ncbi:RING/U-BOX SUPERFAMILY PROTEIN [Salix viminalis]|uniref:RING-type E3 ubiquitin transferase n=1 Tax=Salix viminalis TaxID=40686 RepID=A0A9Q0TYS8_SALVM|nr:RING/U-BOX SUPERFAMILY PROTEIN [Salix viminalis]